MFSLHTKLTPVILLVFFLFTSVKEYFGVPIVCICKTPGLRQDFLDHFCWTSSTFSISTDSNELVGSEVPLPGIRSDQHDGENIYHAYYQWVPIVLILQAFFCCVPRWLWNIKEGGLVQKLDGKPIESNQEKSGLIDYLVMRLKVHNEYTAMYWIWICEGLCLINVVAQLALMNRFLGVKFFADGLDALSTEGSSYGATHLIFPRLTKCRLQRFDRSGLIGTVSALCVLPQNVINAKIYVFLWAWFMMMGVLLSILVFYRILLLIIPSFRLMVLRARYRFISIDVLEPLSKKLDVGKWWVFYMLGRNLDAATYEEIATDLLAKLDN